MCDQQRLRPACAYAQSDQSLCLLLEYSMNIKLLTEHHLEFLSLTGGCTDPSESTLVNMPHCWKSHVVAHKYITCKSVNFFISVYTDIEGELLAITTQAAASKYLIIIVIFVKFTTLFKTCTDVIHRERSGSVVECLTRDRRASGSSLTGSLR